MSTIQPLITYLLASGGKESVPESWYELAVKFGIGEENSGKPNEKRLRACAAKQRWIAFLGTKRGLELKSATFGKDGEVASFKMGRAMEPKEIPNTEGMPMKFVTVTPNGGAYVRYESERPPKEWMTEKHREDFEARLKEARLAAQAKSIQFNPEGDYENWLVIGCVHVPGHNRFLWDGLLRLIGDSRPKGLIIAGDFADLKSLSSHEKGQERSTTLWDEYIALNLALDELDSVLQDGTKKAYIAGNHEDRYYRVLKEVENSRFGAALISPGEGMKLKERGYEVLNNWKEDYVLLGDSLEVCHGLYTGKSSARRHLDISSAVQRSCLYFHTHQKGYATNGYQSAYNCGFLGDMEHDVFKYVSRQERQAWQNGFAFVTISEGKHFVSIADCMEKHFFLNGKKY